MLPFLQWLVCAFANFDEDLLHGCDGNAESSYTQLFLASYGDAVRERDESKLVYTMDLKHLHIMYIHRIKLDIRNLCNKQV